MWHDRWIEEATRVATSFNNDLVFQEVRVHNPEYNRDIVYRPLPLYMRRRFIRHIELLGPQTVDEQLRNPAYGQAHSFSRETRVLALLTGLRETGMPLIPGHRPSVRAKYEVIHGTVYLRNFVASGLDYINQPRARRGVLDHLEPRAATRRHQHLYDTRVVQDDPDSTDRRDVLINQRWLVTIFNAYLRYQRDEFLHDMPLDQMDRPVRLFWRALTFFGQAGATWQNSARTGRAGLETFKNLMDLLGLPYAEVPRLWLDGEIPRLLAQIGDEERHRLASLARQEHDTGSIEQMRAQIPGRIRSGLTNAVWFQSIKMAAITEGFLVCMDQGLFLVRRP